MTFHAKVSVAAAGLALLLGGCSQFYNGAWGLRGRSQPTQGAPAYATAAQPEPTSAAAASRPTVTTVSARREDIGFEDPATLAAGMTKDAQKPTYNVNTEASPISALGLYGDIKPPDDDPRTSPLDAPGNIRRVTFTTEGADFDVAVHPAKDILVYASTRHRDTSDIYLKTVDGAAVTQLTDDPANDVMPAISPDGKMIAFASDRSGTWDIYVMDVDGGQAIQVTNDGFNNMHPSFSPDGKKLVYCSLGSMSGQWELVIIDVDNPTVKQHIGHGLLPEWSPAGDRIVFQRARQKGTRWFSVWTVDLVSGQPTNFTEVAASANAAAITPSWDAKGEHIVFCTVLDPGSDEQIRPNQADIWVMRADGTGRSRLTSGEFTNLQPAWAADGTIFFVSDRAQTGVENIWAARPDQALRLVDRGSKDATTRSASVETEP